MLDHARSPRTPLGGTQYRDLARALVEGQPITADYHDLAALVIDGHRHNADPRGIAIAGERLTAAAERGNRTAADHLAEIREVTR